VLRGRKRGLKEEHKISVSPNRTSEAPSNLQQTVNMTIPASSQVSLSHLHRADGSATYSYNGYQVVGAVNGPVEVMRRDELPEEAAIDVIVRPNAGVGGATFPSPGISAY
jgi:hypothetical protein